MRVAALLLGALALALGCGYRPLRTGLAGHPQIQVLSGETQVPAGAGADVAEELASGARAELSRYGALGAEFREGGAPVERLRLEIVRLDDASEGIAVSEGRPHARGIRLRVIARGVVTGAKDTWETADVEATEMVSASSDPLAWDAARKAAARFASRRAGAMVAREVLGVP